MVLFIFNFFGNFCVWKSVKVKIGNQWKKPKLEEESEEKPEYKEEGQNALDWWFNWTIDQPMENPNLEDEIQKVLHIIPMTFWFINYDSSIMIHQ